MQLSKSLRQDELEELSRFLGWLCRKYDVQTPLIDVSDEVVMKQFDGRPRPARQAGKLSYKGRRATITLFLHGEEAQRMLTLAHELHHLRKDLRPWWYDHPNTHGYAPLSDPAERELDQLATADLKEYRQEAAFLKALRELGQNWKNVSRPGGTKRNF